MSFTKTQPHHGETVLHCEHIAKVRGDKGHFWKLVAPHQFVRPDGTTGLASWIAACGGCFARSGGDAANVDIKGDKVWQGNAPAIRSGN